MGRSGPKTRGRTSNTYGMTNLLLNMTRNTHDWNRRVRPLPLHLRHLQSIRRKWGLRQMLEHQWSMFSDCSIGEMIALDSQPFSIMDDDGFVHLLKVLEPHYTPPSRKYMTEMVVPRIMEGMTAVVRHKIAGIEYYSFTTDIWSMSVSNACLLSLTAHWISPFERMTVVLHAQPIHAWVSLRV